MLKKSKACLLAMTTLLLASCGDFPDYRYDQSNDFCVMSFPFAGGIIGRKYIGSFRVISSLQYLDEDPSYKILITGPSHIELEPGSVQQVIIDGKVYKPKYEAAHLVAELQLWGPSFLFTKEESTQIYQQIRDGNDISIIGRIEIGHQYETDIYNFFFDSAEEPFRSCINRLLNEEDMLALEKSKLNK